MRNPDFCQCKNKAAELISAFDLATWIVHVHVQFLFFLNPKFQASNLFSETVQAGLCRTWSEIPKTGFLTAWLIYYIT